MIPGQTPAHLLASLPARSTPAILASHALMCAQLTGFAGELFVANRVLDPPHRSKPVADGSAFQMQRQVMKCGYACASRAREAVNWTRAQRRRHRGT